MKLLVGLGNPGRKYEQTRHNVGFVVAEKVAVLTSAATPKTKFEGEVSEGSIGGEKLVILCPHTFMNASGQSVRKAVDFYKLNLNDVLVVCDDLNLASGRLRIRPSGSAGGQNGIKDIIRHLSTESFPRLRVGIGRPPQGWAVIDYVLGKFTKPESEIFETATTAAARAAMCWATDGIVVAMNQFNVHPDAKNNQARNRSSKKQQPNSDAPRDNATESDSA